MPRFAITAALTTPADSALSRVTDLVLGPGDILYGTTRFDGQITSWDIGGPVPVQVATRGFDSGVIAGNQPALATLNTDAGPALLSGGGPDGSWMLHSLSADGQFGSATPLTSLTHPLIQPVTIPQADGTISVYAGLLGRSGLVHMTITAAGDIAGVTYLRDTKVAASGDITALTGTMLGDSPYLIGASTKDAGISAWQVYPGGPLSMRSTLRAEDGLRLATPTALDSVILAGQTYVIAAGATSDSLTVLRLNPDKSLQITDHVIDDRNTRFDGVTALASVTHNGAVWVFAGGADDGISAFQLLEDGRLLHRAQIADTPDSTLANISALSVRSETGGIAVFATSATEPGLTALWLAIDPADQVIRDTASTDTLTGGTGADVFVLGPDGAVDTIADFQPGTDRIDLSGWTGLRSIQQLVFAPLQGGLQITYGDETLLVLTTTGAALAPDALTETDLIPQTTLPLVLTPGTPGPVTDPPALPDRYIPPPGIPPPVPPAERVEDYGTGTEDDITGGPGPDLLFGQSGDDRLRGAGGDDLLFGGPGRDRLDGQDGDDQLFGGEGRDLGWMRPANPVADTQGDRLTGGPGDDRLYGQAGRDRLDGGEGNDLLVGGAGRDTFVFRSGHDVIADFDPLIDRLLLDPVLWAEALQMAEVVARFQGGDQGDLILTFDPDHSLRFTGFDDADSLIAVIGLL